MGFIHSLTSWQWALGVASALMVGLSKTGLPGLGILFVPLFAMVLPARISTGALLPLLLVGDVFAVSWYHRHAVWHHLVRLLPWAVAGIVLGFFALGVLNDRVLRPLIGAIIIVLLAVTFWRDTVKKGQASVPAAWWFAAIMGLIAGATTMVADARGTFDDGVPARHASAQGRVPRDERMVLRHRQRDKGPFQCRPRAYHTTHAPPRCVPCRRRRGWLVPGDLGGEEAP